MDGFKKLHPAVNFIFIAFVIALSCVINSPFYTVVSFLSVSSYLLYTEKKKAVKTIFTLALPICFIVGIFNMLFTHYGETILFTVNDMNFTFESLIYGLNQGVIFASLTLWLFVYGSLIDSQKFLSLFSRFFSKLSLLLSTAFSFFSRFRRQQREIKEARIGLLPTDEKSFKESLNVFNSLISVSIESSIITANSMSAKGYKGVISSYDRYHFSKRDLTSLIFIIVSFLFATIFYFSFGSKFIFEPKIEIVSFNFISYIFFVLLLFYPIIFDLWEDVKWHILKSKI